VPGFEIREKMFDIGRIDRLIRAWVKNSENLEIITEAESIFNTFPPLDYFENLPRDGSDEFFFKGLVSMVRTSVLSLQAGIHLEKNKVEKEMGCELINL
jgi:hypothetical protein